jgi:hypothetical protein
MSDKITIQDIVKKIYTNNDIVIKDLRKDLAIIEQSIEELQALKKETELIITRLTT